MRTISFSRTANLALIGFLLILPFLPNLNFHCQAVIVWSDNFNDGNYDGWTVELGSFSASDNTLRGTTTTNALKHDTQTTQGTWSFDVQIFQGSTYTTLFAEETSGGIATNCYTLRINQYHIDLLRSTNWQNTLLDMYDPPETIAGWQQIDVTRDANGQFYVYVNGSLRMDVVDTTHNTANYFVFYSNQGEALDNVVVSNSIDITPPPDNTTGTTPPPGIPGFPIDAIVLGVLISITASLIIRRHRQRSQPNKARR